MTIQEIKTACARSTNNRFYFSPDTMRFFQSKVYQTTFTTPNDPSGRTWFITSEQSPHNPRRFSVRVFDPATTEIATVGQFQEHLNFISARRAAKFVSGAAK